MADRDRFEYHHPQGRTYVLDTEPSLEVKPLFARTLRLEGFGEAMSEAERQRVLQRIVVMLQFSGDEFRLVN